jgi:hypothetical protein
MLGFFWRRLRPPALARDKSSFGAQFRLKNAPPFAINGGGEVAEWLKALPC